MESGSYLALSKFAEKIRANVKDAYNINYNETGEITMWINDLFIMLNPELEENGEFIYTTIIIIYPGVNLRVLGRLYLSSSEIEFEDEQRRLTCKIKGKIEADPVELSNEEELFNFLNEIAKITDLDEFRLFAESEFKNWAGLI